MPVYYGRSAAIEPGAFPSILAIGDSWFWYPLPSGYNLLQQLAARVLRHDYANVLSLGQVGAKLEEYVDGRYAADLRRELEPQNAQYYSAVFVSGAGNDAVDWSLALAADCRAADTPEDCFDDARFDALMRNLSGWLGRLIHDIRWAWRGEPPERHPRIFMHCYDYAPPDGRGATLAGFALPFGPWLKPALDRARVAPDAELRRAVVKRLIDRVHDTFAPYDDDARRVHLIDSRGCLDPATDWDNELHPDTRGFRKLAEGPWRAELARWGYA
jgi:hypothetical protein